MAKRPKLMAGKDMADTKFLTDAGLNETTAEKLVDYGVTELQDLADIDFEDEDFKKLELNKIQVEKLKKRAQCLQEFKNMKPDCIEELEKEGLTHATLLELDKHGVVNQNSLKGVSESVIKKMALEDIQRDLLKNIIADRHRAQTGTSSGIHVSNCTEEYGDVTGGSHVGLVHAGKMDENTGPISVRNLKRKIDRVDGSYAVAVSVGIMEKFPLPEPKNLGETDELIPDMSDGPLTSALEVKNCSQEFYSTHKKEAYSMEKTPRGGVLIINVQKVKDGKPRNGTDVDRDKLKELFEQLHFNVTVYNDCDGLTKQEIEKKVKAFADAANEEQGEAYVVCLLSHGRDDRLCGTDGGLLPFDDVFRLFDDQHCPNLKDNPKMFFIQACRVEKSREVKKPKGQGGRSNMFVGYPTPAGCKAFRKKKTGSWFVEAITKVFAQYAHQEDIMHMMYRVHYAVHKILEVKPDKEESRPEAVFNLIKPLYFFPGIHK